MQLLKQSTAVTIQITLIGTDGTRQTGKTISQGDIKLSKNGGTYATKNDTTNSSHDSAGNYKVVLNATDTATLGRLTLDCVEAGVIFVPMEFLIVTANIYDTYCGTDSLDVNLNANQSAATVGTCTEITNKTGFSLATDQTAVTVGTVSTLTNKTGFSLSSSGVDAIWDEPLRGHTTAGTTGLTLTNLLKIGKNKWAYDGTTFTIYNDNGTDVLYQFTLDSATTPTSRTPV